MIKNKPSFDPDINKPPSGMSTLGLPPPLWLKKLLDRASSADPNDHEAYLLQRYKSGAVLHRLSKDPEILDSLSSMRAALISKHISDTDERLTQFVFEACIGYSLAKSTFRLPPSERVPRIKALARQAHRLANMITLEAKSFLSNTDRLSYLIEQRERPPGVSVAALGGLRGDRFKLSPLPTLRDTLLCFEKALEEQALLAKQRARTNQTPVSNYVDRLIRASVTLFPNINRALIANVASVVCGKSVSASMVEKRVKRLKPVSKR